MITFLSSLNQMLECCSVDPVLGLTGFEFHSKAEPNFWQKAGFTCNFHSEFFFFFKEQQTIMQLSLFLSPSSFVNSNLIKKRKLCGPITSTFLVFYINIIDQAVYHRFLYRCSTVGNGHCISTLWFCCHQ